MQEGVYVGGRSPYGYIKSSDDQHKLIVDKPTADTVRQIFELTAAGTNSHEIARRLNTAKQALLGQLMRYRDVLTDSLNQPSIECEVLPELQWVEMELFPIRDITRRLYEDLVKGILDKQGFMELKSGYQKTLDTLNGRAAALTQALDNEKTQNSRQLKMIQVAMPLL